MAATCLACLAFLLSACEPTCVPTFLEAEQATVVDPSDIAGSAVLRAVLSSGGAPLPAKTIEFTVNQVDGSSHFVGEGETGEEGKALLDLKNRPVKLVRGVVSDSYRADFRGDETYCSSSDLAEIRTAPGV